MYDLTIIGGGASGLATAISCKIANPQKKICIIERNDKVGKKMYATGNGKCNLTNTSCLGVEEILDFFSAFGILTKADDFGRIYPINESASDVVKALENTVNYFGVEVKCNTSVDKIDFDQNKFIVNGSIESTSLVVATGGKAAPEFGCKGDGYKFAKSAGHSVNKTYPVLTALECKEIVGLKGVRSRGIVRLLLNEKELCRETGEIQFTEDGLSGICIFNLSTKIKIDEKISFDNYTISINLLPGIQIDQAKIMMAERCKIKGFKSKDLLISLVNEKLAKFIIKEVGIDENIPADKVSQIEIDKLVAYLKFWNIKVLGAKGWKKAQCTGGGVSLNELNPNTMESNLVSNLYFTGEVLDYDGPCGGFNLNNAWQTGIKAGKAVANV